MSYYPPGNAGNAAFRDYPPGPHSGVDPDPDSHVADGSLDPRARNTLILGVLSLVLGFLAGIPAIWMGRRALTHLRLGGGDARSVRAAWAGILLGCVGIALTVGLWLYLHAQS